MRSHLLNLRDTGSSQSGLCANPSLSVQGTTSVKLFVSLQTYFFLEVSLQCLSRVPSAGHFFLAAHGRVAQDATRLAAVVL